VVAARLRYFFIFGLHLGLHSGLFIIILEWVVVGAVDFLILRCNYV
jgi:hypothetical protein